MVQMPPAPVALAELLRPEPVPVVLAEAQASLEQPALRRAGVVAVVEMVPTPAPERTAR